MTFPPFSEAEVLMTRALFIPTELTMQTVTDFARRLALLGKPGPFRSSPHNVGLVVDRDGDILLMVSPDVAGGAVRRDAAEITALALNRLCGFQAVEDQLDPSHIAAVRVESERFAAQTRQQAAE